MTDSATPPALPPWQPHARKGPAHQQGPRRLQARSLAIRGATCRAGARAGRGRARPHGRGHRLLPHHQPDGKSSGGDRTGKTPIEVSATVHELDPRLTLISDAEHERLAIAVPEHVRQRQLDALRDLDDIELDL